MKNLLVSLLFLVNFTVSAQAYFPGFDDLFLGNNTDESLFSPELNYFRDGLKVTSKLLFIKNLQTSSSRSAAFYSFGVIPRSDLEYDFLNSGVFLKFNVNAKEKYPSFDVTFNEFVNEDKESGNGRIDLYDKGLSLLFTEKNVKVFDFQKRTSIKGLKAEFLISNIEYKINKTNLEIVFKGNFTTDINIKGKKFKKEILSQLTLNADKKGFAVFYIDSKKNKKKYIAKKNIENIK